MPGEDRIGTSYTEALLEARARGFAIGGRSLELVEAAFRNVILQLEAELADDLALTPERATAIREQLLDLLGDLETEIAAHLTQGVRLTVEQVVALHQEVVLALAGQFAATEAASLVAGFAAVPARTVAVLAARRVNAATFETLVRRHLLEAAPALDELLISGIARGVSSRRLAGEIADLLRGEDPAPGPLIRASTALSDADRSAIRSLEYDARRIAVTETNNALREANTQALLASPIVLAAKWQTSGRHHVLDECDVLATFDFYGFGPGMYPPEFWPLAPHPFCACVQGGPVLFRRPSEWGAPRPPAPALRLHPATIAFPDEYERAWTIARVVRARATLARSLAPLQAPPAPARRAA
jgi:hypothetical protein